MKKIFLVLSGLFLLFLCSCEKQGGGADQDSNKWVNAVDRDLNSEEAKVLELVRKRVFKDSGNVKYLYQYSLTKENDIYQMYVSCLVLMENGQRAGLLSCGYYAEVNPEKNKIMKFSSSGSLVWP